ncbi:hypothetical protein Y717_14545 [Streptomyces scopuliridis RB72]|uniref:Uncharacterized protein n=1 Tax=Streptomyces scopuliridis RB72 TaxID=1440053 RepID=A0A2T7TEW1_9ACTN|nr:hypothetical protein Y717_14545 [Streptomyces scopuliridis RB72]
MVWGRADGAFTSVRLDDGAELVNPFHEHVDRRPITGIVRIADREGWPQFAVYADEPDPTGDDPVSPMDTVEYSEVNGRAVATTSGWDFELVIRDAEDWQLKHRLVAHQSNMWVLRTGPDEVNMVTLPQDRHVTRASVARVGRRTLAVSAHRDGFVRCWDLDLDPRAGHEWPGMVRTLGWTALDGRPALLTVDDYGTAILWDPESGRELDRLAGLGRLKKSAVVTVEGKPCIVFANRDSALECWSIEDEERTGCTEPLPDAVTAMTNGSGSTVIIGTASGAVQVWHTDLLAPLQTLQGAPGEVRAVVYGEAAGGRVVAALGMGDTLTVWESAAQDQPLTIALEPRSTEGLACLADTQQPIVAVGFKDGRIGLWSARTGECLRLWKAHRGSVTGLAFQSEAGEAVLVSGGEDKTLRSWTRDGGVEAGGPAMVPGYVRAVSVHGRHAAVTFLSDANENRTDVALFGPAPAQPAADPGQDHGPVRHTHVLAWTDGELLCGDAAASGWDLYTLEDWNKGVQPTHVGLGAFPREAGAEDLLGFTADILEREGFDTVFLEPQTFQISLGDGEWHSQPAFSVHAYPEGPGQRQKEEETRE